MKTVCVLGSGAWGTAIATVLAHNGLRVKLWCYEKEVADQITETGINEKYLPGIQLSPRIVPTIDLADALCESEFVFEAIPVEFLRVTLMSATHCFDSNQTWIILSKGIEQKTLMLPTAILDDVFGRDVKKMVLAGPSFAADVARQKSTAVMLAARDSREGAVLQSLLANDYFCPYLTTDLIGVQIGGAFKNVITLGVGMLEGAGYTDNAKAFFITRGLAEMAALAVALGGTQETIYGLAGVGDLVLTSTSMLSKNLRFGVRIGQGALFAVLKRECSSLPEGVNTVQSVMQLATRYPHLKLSLSTAIAGVLFNDVSVHEMMRVLMRTCPS